MIEASATLGGRMKTRPVVVASRFGRGNVIFVGVNELWRTRYDVGDRYFARFWTGALRSLRSARR